MPDARSTCPHAQDIARLTKDMYEGDQFAPGTNFTAWMYAILRNEFISTMRRGKRFM